MKNTIKNIPKLFTRHNIAAGIGTTLIILLITIGSKWPAGWLTYFASAPALLGMLLTSIARINDISPTNKGWVWHARRFGLALIGSISLAFLYLPFSAYPLFPSWLVTALFWGYFITWVSSPNMPPWYKYIIRDKKESTRVA